MYVAGLAELMSVNIEDDEIDTWCDLQVSGLCMQE